MSEERKTSGRSTVDRRSVLKKLGVGGLAVAGIPSVASADELDPSDDYVDYVLQKDKVQSIQEDVGEFKVESVERKEIKQRFLTLTAAYIETSLGTLIYTEINSSDTEAQLNLLDISNNPDVQTRLPDRYQDVPSVSDIVLVGGESSVSLSRSVTDNERSQLKQAVTKSGETFITAFNDDIDGYKLLVLYPDENKQLYHVGKNGQEISSKNTEPVFTTTGCCNDCIETLVIGRGFCYASCYLAGTVVGGVVCLACLAYNGYQLTQNCPGCNIDCA